MTNSSLLIVLSSILMSSSAHILLKKGMMTYASNTMKPDGIINVVWSLGLNLWILGGMFLHVGALFVWLWALSKIDISLAYPFIALGYVLVSAMAWLWLGEEIDSTRMFGMGIIVIGIFVLAKGG